MTLLRFWVCQSASLVRIEYGEAGHTHQAVAAIYEPSWETNSRPSVSAECPDAIAERVAELAYEALDNGTVMDRRFVGWDDTADKAWAACDAANEDAFRRHADACNEIFAATRKAVAS